MSASYERVNPSGDPPSFPEEAAMEGTIHERQMVEGQMQEDLDLDSVKTFSTDENHGTRNTLLMY